MIWLGLIVLSALALLPLAIGLRRGDSPRGRRDAALALHRAQLHELHRDLAEGRLRPEEHEMAVLEVQRRLLATDAEADRPAATQRSGLGFLALALIPLAALSLYLIHGNPGLPAAPLQARLRAAAAQEQNDQAIIDQLKAKIATLDPHSDMARKGYLLLGNVEARRGNMAGAAAAWNAVLSTQFDPTLAVETAEAMTESAGHVTAQSAALFRRALQEAPADAPWRPMAEKRLSQQTQPATTP